MNRISHLLILLAVAASSLNFAHAGTAKPTNAVLEAYLKIQESLANDSLKEANESASLLAKSTQDKSLVKQATAISRDKSLEDARTHFKTLSASMSKWAEVAKPEGIDRMTCPMVKASWLQKHGAVKNPYYGKQMLSCGEIQK